MFVTMYQTWKDLFFIHWTIPATEIQKSLPSQLFVDTFEGKAYIGAVFFRVLDARPRFVPPLPFISNFLEINLRTYVRDAKGNRGIWFYSLDANQILPVIISRLVFHLPYFFSQIQCEQRENCFHFSLRKKETKASLHAIHENKTFQAISGSLDHFLIERYLLFTVSKKNLYSLQVEHPSYDLAAGELISYHIQSIAPYWNIPSHVLYSPGVAVKFFRLKKVE